MGIMLSLGLLPVSQGEARAQWLYLRILPPITQFRALHKPKLVIYTHTHTPTRDRIPDAMFKV